MTNVLTYFNGLDPNVHQTTHSSWDFPIGKAGPLTSPGHSLINFKIMIQKSFKPDTNWPLGELPPHNTTGQPVNLSSVGCLLKSTSIAMPVSLRPNPQKTSFFKIPNDLTLKTWVCFCTAPDKETHFLVGCLLKIRTTAIFSCRYG